MSLLGGAWTPNLIWTLSGGPRRFGELRASLPGISPKTLTAQLRHLEAVGVLTRHAFAEVPPRVEYRLTERGRHLEPILLAMWEWGYDELVPDGPNPLRMPEASDLP